MKTYYKNDLKRAYLVLEGKEGEKEDYQAVMLRENDIPGILKTDVRCIDNRNHYYYDISGKTSFGTLHEKINLSCDNMKGVVSGVLFAIKSLQKYMLDGNCILLSPEWIFCSGDQYFFCYYPFCEQNIKEEFHKLTEFFVREVDYKDEEGVRFAYTLHKATMEENYSIEEIMLRLVPKKEQPEELPHILVEDDEYPEEDDDDEDDEDENPGGVFRRIFDRILRKPATDEEEDL